MHARTHARARAHGHPHAHAHTHTHRHTSAIHSWTSCTYPSLLSNQSTVSIEKASNRAKSGGICFPKVCLLSHVKIGQPKPSGTCISFDWKLWKILLIIVRPFWPAVKRLSFVAVSLTLDVTKIATIRHNYSLASGILRNILKACWRRCAFGGLSRTKQQICQCLNNVDSAVSWRFVEFSIEMK